MKSTRYYCPDCGLTVATYEEVTKYKRCAECHAHHEATRPRERADLGGPASTATASIDRTPSRLAAAASSATAPRNASARPSATLGLGLRGCRSAAPGFRKTSANASSGETATSAATAGGRRTPLTT